MLKIERGREYLPLSHMLYYYPRNCCCAKATRRFVTSPPTEPLERDAVLDLSLHQILVQSHI